MKSLLNLFNVIAYLVRQHELEEGLVAQHAAVRRHGRLEHLLQVALGEQRVLVVLARDPAGDLEL